MIYKSYGGGEYDTKEYFENLILKKQKEFFYLVEYGKSMIKFEKQVFTWYYYLYEVDVLV
jgi:hypothetical protein